MTNPFNEFLQRYRRNSAAFVREVLAVEPDPWQAAVMAEVDKGTRQISIRSCHGPGKSALLSWLSVHRIVCWFPQKTVQTAPSGSQLWDALWAETVKWANHLPPHLREVLEIKSDRIELKAAPEESFISARTARPEKPEAFQGVHSPSVLLIADEASGIDEAIFEAGSGSMSGEHATTILAGNAIRSSGLFFDSHHSLRTLWKTFWVAPACDPEAVDLKGRGAWLSERVSKKFLDEIEARYGRESNAYRIRCLGEFPRADDDTVIPFELVESAIHRDIMPNPKAPIVWGVDVARFGNDANALAIRQAHVVPEPVQTWRGKDLMQTVGLIKAKYDETRQKPTEILVDVIGLGAGVCDRLRELGLPVRGINVGESASTKGQYANLATELWFRGRDWLAQRSVKLPDDDTLFRELTARKYSYTSNGALRIESKEDFKKREPRIGSPDTADAFLLTFAADAATMAGSSRRSWAKPFLRNSKWIV